MNQTIKYLFGLFTLFLLGCGGKVIPPNPLNDLKKEYKDKYAYTVVLQDMDLKDEQYKHKYKVFEITKEDEVNVFLTDWKNVDDDFFALHESNLGMEVLSKSDNGKLNNLATPPGFTHFVGNEHYGFWTGGGNTNIAEESQLWQFYPNWQYLGIELEINHFNISLKEYNEFNGKYIYNRPYYGEKYHKDSTKYGTYSHFWIFIRPGFYSRRRSNDYFNKNTYGGNSGGFRGGGGFGK